jgi:hypothetical protein
MRRLLVLLIACDAGVPAKPAPKPQPPVEVAHEYADCATISPREGPDVLATLHRHACYGQCPVYDVVVHRNGRVEYTASKWVAKCSATDYLEPFELGALRGALEMSHLFDMKDKYLDEDWTDASTVDISYQPTPGHRKLVEHYHGDTDAPHDLTVVEDVFDLIVGTDRWVRVELPE